jgi:16S rRNA (cytidine1402-2'-O)-methyltransferase
VAENPVGTLLLVATPIGNARDITLRALDALKDADALYAEDTRVTAKLLALHGLSRSILSYHEHNAQAMRPRILARLAAGERVALVSDAGTPLISDPGYKLVRAAIEAGYAVEALPGASAVMAALSVAGLPTDRFFFAGFLPPKAGARARALEALKEIPATLVFFESPGRLAESLAAMAGILGSRAASVARELTKLFEETRRGTLADLSAHYVASGPPKGEIVVLVGPPEAAGAGAEDAAAALDQALRAALDHSSLRDAVEAVARATGRPRRKVYARALALVGRKDNAPKP